ncbi:site-specific integrase [Stutzerimonas nosocomialis]|uniref:Site-specific integrase n=1 Tax=Stutzerimonas nosocomialis TaxID=1056496 RepID=A0A5R9QII6_9GAMM|nr:tyrosine-type recombinase/integrase [Stutzerimonas nosocomialis]TLX65106.1 site-specific integrase [Stutzerimonas nosocomialis]
MGTITARPRKSGGIGYTAQVRIKREGKLVYQESQTFDRKQAAQAWLKRRETELAEPRALERANRKASTLRDIIDQYLEEYERIRPLGKTKRATLKAIGSTWLGDLADTEVTSQRLVEFAQWRMRPEGGAVQAQTAGNDLAHLGAVMSVAKPAWGYEVDPHAMADARKVLRKLGMNSRSRERDRRPTMQELDKLLEYFFEVLRRRPSSIHMPKVIAFAIFSTRRQDEITRIRWDRLDEQRQAALVTDMKNPGQKIGNDVWCHLPDEAWAILQSMPKGCLEPFPYNSDSISTAFTQACKYLDIKDLHFHDLRHDGVSRLFEMDWDIPRVASVSAHRDWNSLRRYTHLRSRGDRYVGWKWLPRIIEAEVTLGARQLKEAGA